MRCSTNQKEEFADYVMIQVDPDALKYREFDLRSQGLMNFDEATALTLRMNYSFFKRMTMAFTVETLPACFLRRDCLAWRTSTIRTQFSKSPGRKGYTSTIVSFQNGFDWANWSHFRVAICLLSEPLFGWIENVWLLIFQAAQDYGRLAPSRGRYVAR